MKYPPMLRYGSWRDVELTRLEEERHPNQVRNFWLVCFSVSLLLLAIQAIKPC